MASARGILFFFYLERKYSPREETNRFWVSHLNAEISLADETVARPVRFNGLLVFLLKNTVAIVLDSGAIQYCPVPANIHPIEPVVNDNGIFLWAGDNLFQVGFNAQIQNSLALDGAGVILFTQTGDYIVCGLTNQDIIFWDGNHQLKYCLHSLAIASLGVFDGLELICLQNSEIVALNLKSGAEQILTQVLQPELAGMLRSHHRVYAICQYGQMFVLDLNDRSSGFLALTGWNREWFTPRVIGQFLCFVDRDRSLRFIPEESTYSVIPYPLSGELLLHRFYTNGGFLVLQIKGGFTLIWFTCNERTLRINQMTWDVSFRPLGVNENCLHFAAGKDWLCLHLDWDVPQKVNEVTDLVSVFSFPAQDVEYRGQKLMVRRTNSIGEPEVLILQGKPVALAHEQTNLGILGIQS